VDDININHKNSKYHSNITLDENVTATDDLKEALKDASLVVCCLPVQSIPEILEKIKDLIDPKVPFCSCSKGMLVSKRKFVSELIAETFGASYPFCVLSGPSFAEEIIKKHPTLVVVAAAQPEVAKFGNKNDNLNGKFSLSFSKYQKFFLN
jgi:glycerol-3-phosphate dehydrogenase (NAD(P)+)